MQNHLSLLKLKGLLKPMGAISSITQDNSISFQKNGITFAKLNNGSLYFLKDVNEFSPIEPGLIEDLDKFLKAATKSYYFAAGNKKCA